MNDSRTYRSQIYREFQEVQQNASWHSLTRFYEKHERSISNLDFEEYFELLLCYTGALFETGAYRKHIAMADTIIEISILQNISHFRGDDIYTKTLFRKAASHYNLSETTACEHILRELIKMNPQDDDAIAFLRRCIRSRQPRYIQDSRALAIVLFFLSALVICVEVLFIRNFAPDYTNLVMGLRTGIFVLGLFALVSGDLYHRWETHNAIQRFVEQQRQLKKEQL